jgi:hypothetical protein
MKDLLVHLFLPHHTNNHRAKVLQINALFIYLLFFVVFNLTIRIIHRSAPEILGYATDIYVDQLFADTNNVRTVAGLPSLNLNSQLSQAAANKAQYMFEHNFWAHNSPDGRTPWEFITASGYKYSLAGENLAKNFNNSQSVVDAWMASPSHRDNLLKSGYQDVGFAVVNGTLNGEQITLVVQMFGSTNVPQVAKLNPVVPTEAAKTAIAEVTANNVLKTENTAPNLNLNPTLAPTLIPSAIPTIIPIGSNLIINKTPISNTGSFAGITLKPLIDIHRITRVLAYMFIGILLILFIVDAYIVTTKRVIRVTGHTIGHVLFLLCLTIAITLTVPGAIL